MISIILSAGILKGFFFFFFRTVMHKENHEEWLQNDRFIYSEKHSNKKFLFEELETLKTSYRIDLKQKLDVTPEDNFDLILSNRLRIEKLRMIILNDVKYYDHLNKSTGVTYVQGRAYWLDTDFKKTRTFSRGMGKKEDVYINGKHGSIHPDLKNEAEQEVFNMMLEKYRIEYPY